MNSALVRILRSLSTGLATDDMADAIADGLGTALIFPTLFGFLLAVDMLGGGGQ